LADPLKAIVEALSARPDLLGWTAAHRRLRGEQLFSDRTQVEVRRSVETDNIAIDVLCASDGDPGQCGAARAMLNVGQAPGPAIEVAVRAAQRTRNPIYQLPGPSHLPDVPTTDAEIIADPAAAVAGLHERLMRSSASRSAARLTLAEWFAEHEETHLVNSRGVDALQAHTQLSLEWIVLAGQGKGRVDTTFDLNRRRLADLDVEAEWDKVAHQTADRERAQPAPSYVGPVILRGSALEAFLNSGTIATLTSGKARFSRISPWEPGMSVFRGEVLGDGLTMWATRLIPYADHAGRFDEEGLPGQRTLLIEKNVFQTYCAGQRYATYLSVPATGASADLEIPPGATPQTELLAGPHVEVVSWSWFSPEPTTGDFASEIRLGYLVDGADRRPFSGGLLVGNVLEALANVRWSSETGFFGSYLGPTTARFTSLKITPSRDA
jgi:predicted Zn-dependent protease